MPNNYSARQRYSLFVGCCVFAALPVIADTLGQISGQQPSSSQPIEQSATVLLNNQQSRAAQWGLDETEWQRYRFLMRGIRGSLSPATLSPIEVLGIHARNAGERQRYAEQWAVMMRDDAERILAFQRAYDDAHRRLFPNGLLIDAGRLSAANSNQVPAEDVAWQPTDRVLFFTDTQCPACDAILERLVSQLDQFAGIDLYLTDVSAGEEPRIREWASSKQIDPRWVGEHKITLNIDAGALDRVARHIGQHGQELPVLVRRRGDRLTPLPVSRF